VTGPTVGEGERVRRRIFAGGPILGLSRAEEYAIAGRAWAARRGLNGHTAGTVRGLLEGLAWSELGPTPPARSLVEGAMARAVDFIERG
jgi:hypothetical protein